MSAEQKRQKKEEPEARQPRERPVADAEQMVVDEEESDYGSIRISESVIAAVVRKYVLDVPGVVRFSSGSIVGGLAEMIGRRNPESSVLVDIEGETVNIGVTLVLEFGVRIPDVAALVQDVIRTRIEELTGKQVTKIDVIIQDLDEPASAEETAEEEAAQ